MKKTISFFILIVSVIFSFAQQLPEKYYHFIKQADSLYQEKDYKNSAITYSKAFKTIGWKGIPDDRYNAACSWALANYPDSAFFQLNRIATKANYKDYYHVTTDPNLVSLHKDDRWKSLLEIVKMNKYKAEIFLNRALVDQLDTIYYGDQQYRRQLDDIEKKFFDPNSKEVKAHWTIINKNDSINLVKVKAILDKYGWLGSDVIGSQGNSTLFLVIQHSDKATQEKYLPMMREAVKNGKAANSSLALLEDRVALGQGKKQIYGSQIGMNSETQQYYVRPLEDPDNVDKRRAAVGLPPLADYVKHWQIKWDLEQYKKDLPALEQKRNAK
ncbi:MAG: DUF6624 domain-containing protein [Bacteroidota bacterium]